MLYLCICWASNVKKRHLYDYVIVTSIITIVFQNQADRPVVNQTTIYMITQTDAWLAEMGHSHRVAFAATVWALFACMANAGAPPNVLRGPFHPPNVNIAPDLNLAIDYVMSSPNQCGETRLRRNGMIYSHKELYEGLQKEGLSLLELNKTSRYYYPDDINCTFTVCVGTGESSEHPVATTRPSVV